MLLRKLVPALFFIIAADADSSSDSTLNCPSNYHYDPSYGCVTDQLSSDRNYGYADCAQSYAYFFKIRNAFDNTAFSRLCHSRCWLGITCNSTDVSSCQYDNGDPVTYSNFFLGQPSNDGSCVFFDASSGLWYSTPCFGNEMNYICQIDQTNTPKYCDSSLYYYFYRDKCYFNNVIKSVTDADNYCQGKGGELVSIHSKQQNTLFYQYLVNYSQTYRYAYLGLQNSGQSYSWNDHSQYDYNNFGMQNPNLGPCVLMSLTNSLSSYNVSAGQWISNACSITNDDISSVCVKDSVAPITPITPILCDSKPPLYTNASGTIYSPGYPSYSLNQLSCEYDILMPYGTNVTVTVDYTSLYYDGQMVFYDTLLPGTSPFQKMYDNTAGTKVYSSSNMMRVVFTAGTNSYFVLKYGQQ